MSFYFSAVLNCLRKYRMYVYNYVFVENLATHKKATSDSVLNGWPTWSADKAVDGNRNTDVYCGSCLHTHASTARNAHSYLNIDLGEESTISRVEIYYRVPYNDQCINGSRLNVTTRK